MHYRRDEMMGLQILDTSNQAPCIQCISTLFTDLVTAGVGPMPAGTPQTMAPEVIDCMLGERSSEFAADGAGKCWSIMVYWFCSVPSSRSCKSACDILRT